MRLTRFAAVAGASVALVLASGIAAPSVALADDYPSWDDVRKAKAGQAATQTAVKRVTAAISGLRARAATAQRAATDAGDTLQQTQLAFLLADQKYTRLSGEATAARNEAAAASTRAGQLAAQLYRTGGQNMSVALLLSAQPGSTSTSTTSTPAKTEPADLLGALGSMSKLTATSAGLWGQAQQTKNAAAAASAQAKAALDERSRRHERAQAALDAAIEASARAQRAVEAEQQHSDELSTMLAALNDKTAKTVAGYEAGVRARAAEAKRKQLEAQRAAQLAAQREAQREAARDAQRPGQQGAAPASTGWVVPLYGPITAGFGPRPAPCAGCSTWHEGVDIGANFGDPIRAAHSGTVVYAGPSGGYGNFILLDHGDGISTAYGHNIDGGIVVRPGQHVSAGEVIGHAGSTGHSSGPHLHFEVRQNGVQINPIPWMAQHGAAL